MKVKLYVDTVWTKIYGLRDDLVELLDEILVFKPSGYFFTNAYQSNKWDGNIHLLKKYPIVTTYTGLLKRILLFLKKEHVEYEIIKSYNNEDIKFNDVKLSGIELRDYQIDIIETCKKKKRGIIQAPTGSGKTEMFVKLVADINVPSLIVVNRTVLLGQLVDKLEKRLELQNSEINIIGSGINRYKKENFITIGTFQSLMQKENEEIIRNAKMVVFDETHHVSANKLGDISKKATNALFKFGFSATPFREDGYDLMIEAHIGPKIKIISISELIKKGYLAKPKIYFIDVPNTMNKKFSYSALYTQLIENKKRNEIIARIAYEKAKQGKIVLISVLRLKHIKYLLQEIEKIDDVGFNIKVITGKDATHEKVRTIKKMNTGEYNIVISTLFGEGVDVPNLNVLINAKAVKSAIDAFQQVGRILRIKDNKETPEAFDFYDYNVLKQESGKDYFEKYSIRKMKLYQSEPEFDVYRVSDVESLFTQEEKTI
jgi:superfamily II DNA or RNA helicase